MSTRETKSKREEIGEEAYQEWLNQPPSQFSLTHPESPIFQNYSNSTSSSHVGDGGNDVEVGLDDFL